MSTSTVTIRVSINGTPYATATPSTRQKITKQAKEVAANVNGRVQRTLSVYEASVDEIFVDVQTDGYANYTASEAIDNWLSLNKADCRLIKAA